MPQRESSAPKSKILLNWGSVNERVYPTELADSELSSNVGTFHRLLGSLTRMFGKRTLAKYSDPVMGIWQFWTPYGYMGGLVQFRDSLEIGPWQVITSKLDLTVPPGELDDGGYTIPDLGLQEWPYESGEGLPDDTNGSPFGNGRHCKWLDTPTDYLLIDYITAQTQCSGSVNTQVYHHGVNDPGSETTGCPLFPYAGVIIGPGGYAPTGPITPVVTITGSPTYSKTRAGLSTLNTPGIDGCQREATVTQLSSVGGIFETTLDLSPLQATYEGKTITAVIAGTYSDDGNITESAIELSLEVDFTDLIDGGNFDEVVFNLSDLLPDGQVVLTSNSGSAQQSRVTVNTLRIYLRTRLCS